MIIEVIAFFIWILILIIAFAVITVRRKKRHKLQGTDNISANLTFPQRNWLPLCLVVALVSPLAVRAYNSLTHKEKNKVPIDRNGAAYLGGDTTKRDTTYHVATPPQH